MTNAMFSRTGSDQFPSWLKCMITGPPKSGKTTLLGTVPNLLVLDTEPHANNLQSIAHLDVPFKAIHSTDDLRQAQFVLANEQFRQQAAQGLGMPAIEGVAIDTVDTLQGIMKRERLFQTRRDSFQRDDWGWLKEEMTSILESFLSLPMHVFFIVHTKSENVGTEENPKTVILPGLEGGIARQIAGMVGYSLLSFRKEEIKPDGSGKYTKYWLRAEGDETYEYLGNRAAGRLPDVIEPDFNHLLAAAMANRPTQQHQQVAIDLGAQRTGQQTPPQQAPQVQPPVQMQQPAPQAQPQTPAPQQVQQQQAPPQQAAPQPAPPQEQQAPADPQARPADTEPMNAAAMGHVKRVYDALQQPFPEAQIQALNLGQARELVRAWQAIAQDDAEGKTPQGQTAVGIMTDYLKGMGLIGEPAPEKPAVVPNVRGTIPEVKAYVEGGPEEGLLNRASEAYEIERTGQNRKTLMEWLESKGAAGAPPANVAPQPVAQDAGQPQQAPQQVQTDVQTQQAPPEPVSAPQTAPAAPAPQPQQAPEQPQQAVTPEPAPADDAVAEAQAVQAVEQGLGGVEMATPDTKCAQCGNTVDDVDLAQLGKSRFGRFLCVADYIAETKK
jgi:outer membrane biosynthesis protein TonB